jgi:hypothetical protein
MNVKDFTRPRVRFIVLCVFALCALTLPASAVAAGHHDASAHKAKAKGKGKKKPKKKSSTTVIVKCASVTVTCKGTPGATGPQGPAGVNGTNGSSVVLRARGAGSVAASKEEESPGCESFTCIGGANVPVSPSTWTQGPTEDDQLIGSTTISLPSEAECAAEDTSTKTLEDPESFVILTVNGNIEGFAIAGTGTNARTVNVSFSSALLIEIEEEEGGEVGTGFFLGNGSSQAHTMVVKAIDNCKATQVTVSNVAIDVLASF